MNTRISIVTFLLTFALLINFQLYAQDPEIIWDNTIRGNSVDYLRASAETPDGGFIIAGYSYSTIGYDKLEYVGNYDYWVLKLNAVGEIEWQNTIGTTVADYLTSIVTTPDGGYLVGGYTSGGISGDKTDAAIGSNDYWIIKLNPVGEIVWQKTIGGTGDDKLSDIMPLPGGGFVLSGYSSSGISGNKTEACIGSYDYWIMKINHLGEILWQYTIGGNSSDYLKKTIRSSDGNFVMAGYSTSGISGHKTEANIGDTDYWVLAIDGSGTVVWQNTIGGKGNDYLNGICELNGGGFILGGRSDSDISGDKSENALNYSTYCWECLVTINSHDGFDYWVVRIDNEGEIIWENSYLGGTEYSTAEVDDVFQYDDNKIMIAGNSEGTFDNLETDLGNDYWLVTIDTNGYITRQQSLSGTVYFEYDGYDEIINSSDNLLSVCLPTSDGGFFVAGSSDALAGEDKSESSYSLDYWVLKLGPDTCIGAPVYADYDGDGEGGDFLANTCELTYGPWVSNNNDCDDLYSSINSTATEICDNLDNNCNGLIDEGIIDCNSGPEIIWDKTLGDTGYNYLASVLPTSDGGIISIGSKTPLLPEMLDADYDEFYSEIEIFKLAADGTTQWHKIISADLDDYGTKVIQTADGGYLIGASSNSSISGDKTLESYGQVDYWILKLNSTGEIVWQKIFGGSSSEYLTDLEITPDGGYIVAGYSYSGASGNKTEISYGGADFWIVKLNNDGEIEWQNSIGGSDNDDSPQIAVDNLNNYYVAGNSRSGISGDKTEIHKGNGDYWALKLNSLGEIVWQNTIGGSSSEQLEDIEVDSLGKLIIVGSSSSGISADKSEVSVGLDYWVVKLTPSGNISWDNTVSCIGNDYCKAVTITPDGGYLIGGYSYAPPSEDKIESFHNAMFDFSYYFPYGKAYDYWILKLDNEGNTIWQNTIGGNLDDYLTSIELGDDEKIILGGFSTSGISGDKSNGAFGPIQEVIEEDDYSYDKHTKYYGTADFWIIQLQPENCTLIDELCNTLDDNCNGLIDDDVLETITISADGAIEFCQGGSVSLTATYSGTSLQWQKNGTNIPGATLATYTVTTKGNYTCVTTSDCGTATSSTIFVNVFKNPAATVSAAGPTTFCIGGSVTLNVTPVAGCSYQWYKDASPIPGATATNYLATTAGIYKCRVTKTATGCFKTSAGIIVTVPCKEGEAISSESTFTISPNPSAGLFTVSAFSYGSLENNTSAQLEIYNAIGQLIYTQVLETTDSQINYKINLQHIASGIYFVRLNTDGLFSEKKLIIQH
ncbi:MAG TPA: MopE-related protein [Chitinophagales bacterium]|nr:MopE-related protein [Chitinophagales bacterium]